MADYKSDQIRNFSVIGHGGCGKTIFSEGILYAAGVTNRFGKIEEGNTISDYHKDEIEKQISINSSLLNAFWKNSKGEKIKLNIIDTPGYMDFLGDVKSSLRVTDTAVILVDAFKSVEVGTEAVFKYTKEIGNNILFVVNKLDSENSNFEHTLNQIKESFGSEVAVIQFPVNEGNGFNSVIDVAKMKMIKFNSDGKGEFTVSDIPKELEEKAKEYHQKLIETIAEEDEQLLERFFEEGANLTEEEIHLGLNKGMKERKLFPVFCASAKDNIGIRPILDFISDYAASPKDVPAEKAMKGDSEIEIKCNPEGDPALFVFKTMSERNVGELSFFRVYSGKINAGMDLLNAANSKSERISQCYSMNGKDRKEMDEVICGDIAGVVKLKDTHTNNTLCLKNLNIQFHKINFPQPNMTLAILPKRKGEEDKIATSLHSLHEEDPTFIVRYNGETSQTIISGQGEIHINTILNRMKNKFGLEVDVAEPKIPYRETIRSIAANVEYKHKKQSGGKGQFGHVFIKVEPQPRGQGFEFVNAIVGGAIPGRFIPAVEKGIIETIKSGVIVGCKVVDVKVTLFDGKFHDVDSDENSFKLAGSMAFKKGFKEANPVILEPIYNVAVSFPEEFMGAVSGDISSRRGRIIGMEADGRLQVIKCQMPLSEMAGYSPKLRSLTQGRGNYTREMSHYEDVPKEVEIKIIADYEKQKAENQ
ncbi:MAG TPA: elongation factor G [Ignavibacteria bacterium]